MTAAVYRGYDRAALDAQYNNRGRVPEAPAFLERYVDVVAGTEAGGVNLEVQ